MGDREARGGRKMDKQLIPWGLPHTVILSTGQDLMPPPLVKASKVLGYMAWIASATQSPRLVSSHRLG